MPAIITDTLKIQNCTNFVESIKYFEDNPSNGNYYMFIGYPNSDEHYSDWESNPQNPTDNFTYENHYKESILGVKKITSTDVIRAIPKITWTSGTRYDMYRHDYSVRNQTKNSGLSRLYDSNYYVMSSNFNVYICLNNGYFENNPQGLPSTIEPIHTDTNELTDKGDGYIWKYLYTVSPSEYLKFDSTNYIPVPSNWKTTENLAISEVRSSAIPGAISTILIEKSTQYLITEDSSIGITCQIEGDGTDGTASVYFNSEGYPIRVEVTNPGSGYTYATLNLDDVVPKDSNSESSIFNVIIPPPGGHGADIYKELGAFRCLVYSRIENELTNPDFIVDNQFARIGILKDVYNEGSSAYFTNSIGTGLYGLAISNTGLTIPEDSVMYQESTGARGIIVSYMEVGPVTFLKYIQPRELYTDTYSYGNITKTFDPYSTTPKFQSKQSATSYKQSQFNTSEITIGTDPTTYAVADINGSEYNSTYLGQTFTNGIASPDINTKSGDVLYVDNRSTITRASNQREDIKIIIEF